MIVAGTTASAMKKWIKIPSLTNITNGRRTLGSIIAFGKLFFFQNNAFYPSDGGNVNQCASVSLSNFSTSMVTMPISASWGAPSFDGTNLCVSSRSYAEYRTASIYVTTDGVTWTSRATATASFAMPASIWDGTRHMFFGNGYGTAALTKTIRMLYSTAPNSSWTEVSLSTALTDAMQPSAVAWNGSSSYIVTGGANARPSTSYLHCNNANPTLAASWTPRTFPTYDFLFNTFYFSGKWIAFAGYNDPSYYTSTDGITWTARTAPFTYLTGGAADDPDFHKFAVVAGSKLYALPQSSTNGLSGYSTTDGINWTSFTVPDRVSSYDHAFGTTDSGVVYFVDDPSGTGIDAQVLFMNTAP